MFRRISARTMGIGLIFFIFCVTQGIFAANVNGDPGSNLAQGKSALEKGDYKNGVQALAKAVEESSSDAEKKEYLEKTLEVIQNTTDGLFGKDDQSADLTGIMEIINTAFGYSFYKNSELLYNQRGSVFKRQGDLDKAFSDYNSALKINSKYSASRFNLALCYYKQKEFKKAYDELGKIPESDPRGAIAKEKRDFLLKNFAQYIIK